LDELLGLRDWLLNRTDEELRATYPKTVVSRAKMLATLDELIELVKAARS
jgi:hypothetical protein